MSVYMQQYSHSVLCSQPRDVACTARRQKKSRHPNRQHLGPNPLWGNKNAWIAVPEPQPSTVNTTPRPRKHVPSHPHPLPDGSSVLTQPAPLGGQPSSSSSLPRKNHRPATQFQTDQALALSHQAPPTAPPNPAPSAAPGRNPSEQPLQEGSIQPALQLYQSDSAGTGRYLDRSPPRTASQVLHTASKLAALAGPDVELRGHRLRRRLGPVQEHLYAGVFGQSQQRWWRWRQWLRSKQPSHSQTQLLVEGTSVPLLTEPPGALSTALSTATHRGRQGGPRLTALTLDDATLDIEDLEPGITEDMLHRSTAEMEAALAADTWTQLLQRLSHSSQPQAHRPAPGTPHRNNPRKDGNQPPRSAQLVHSAHDTHSVPQVVHVFKGGGYRADDLAAMLKVTRLDQVIQLQSVIQGAHCILAMPRWANGKHVNLRQHTAAATHRRIPLVLTRSLKTRDVLLALRPVLATLGMIQDTNHRKVVHLTRRHIRTQVLSVSTGTQAAGQRAAELAQRSSSAAQSETSWDDLQPMLLQQVAEGQLPVYQYILQSQL